MMLSIQKEAAQVDLSPAFIEIEVIVLTSVDLNFSSGGRYGNDNLCGGGDQQWDPSRRALAQGGQTLIDTGQLVASILVRVVKTKNGFQIRAGSNKTYAAVHQLGGTTENGLVVPARPYIVLQNEDLEEIMTIISEVLGHTLFGT